MPQPPQEGSVRSPRNSGSCNGASTVASCPDDYSFYRSFVAAAAAQDPELAAALAVLQVQQLPNDDAAAANVASGLVQEQPAAGAATAAEVVATAPAAAAAKSSSPEQSGGQLTSSRSFMFKPDFTRAQIRSLRKLVPIQAPPVKPAALLVGEYQLLDQLGKGAHGIAYKARHLPSGKLVCIKTVASGQANKQQQHELQAELEQKKREVVVLATLKHPNIVRLFDCFCDDSKLMIVMELMDGGDLQGLLQRLSKAGTFLTEEQLLGYFLQLVLALVHIHGLAIMHRDLKCQNVFVHSQGLLKVGDFGIAKILEASAGISSSGSTAGATSAATLVSQQRTGPAAHSFVGTPNFLAPEMVSCGPTNQKADIWALGCVLYEMATLKPAFKADNITSVYRMIRRGKAAQLPARYSPALRQLHASLMAQDPNDRPTAADILTIHADLLRPHLEHYMALLQQLGLELPPVPRVTADYASTAASSSNGGTGLMRSQMSSVAGNTGCSSDHQHLQHRCTTGYKQCEPGTINDGSHSGQGAPAGSSVQATTSAQPVVPRANLRVALWQQQLAQEAAAADALQESRQHRQHGRRRSLLHRLKKRLLTAVRSSRQTPEHQQQLPKHQAGWFLAQHEQQAQAQQEEPEAEAGAMAPAAAVEKLWGLHQPAQVLAPLRHTLSTVLSANSAELEVSGGGACSHCNSSSDSVVQPLSRRSNLSNQPSTPASPSGTCPAASPARAVAATGAGGTGGRPPAQRSRWSSMLAAAGLNVEAVPPSDTPLQSAAVQASTAASVLATGAPNVASPAGPGTAATNSSSSSSSMSPSALLHMQQLAALYTAQQQQLLPEASGLSTISEWSEASRSTPLSVSFSSAVTPASGRRSPWGQQCTTGAAAALAAVDEHLMNNGSSQARQHMSTLLQSPRSGLAPAGTGFLAQSGLPCSGAIAAAAAAATGHEIVQQDKPHWAEQEAEGAVLSSDALVVISNTAMSGPAAFPAAAGPGKTVSAEPAAAAAESPLVAEQQAVQLRLQQLRLRLCQPVSESPGASGIWGSMECGSPVPSGDADQ